MTAGTESQVQSGNGVTHALAIQQDVQPAMDKVMIAGDLTSLKPDQLTAYYMRVCQSVGLNPYTKPFAFIRLNGKLTLYALRDAADQLRRIRGISIEIVEKKLTEGLLSIHVRATDKDGRKDEDFGIVPVNGPLVGEAGANLLMKAVTKAKRRVTLSICGLGMLDETEVTTVPDVEFVEFDDAGEVRIPEPKPKRKSSAAAKKDGTTEIFNDIDKELNGADGAIGTKAVWDKHAKTLAELPSRWFQLLAETYTVKMGEYEVEVRVEDQATFRAQL